ncbi:MAG: hypothetical protein ACI39U_02740 [Candidatus Cryptobacteroides sp.]
MIGLPIVTMVLAGLLGLQAENTSTQNEHVKSVTSVCKVLGDGRKLAAVAVEYDVPIKNSSLNEGGFKVRTTQATRRG